MSKQDEIMHIWVQFPARWKLLWDICERGEGRYTRGVFVINGKEVKPLQQKTQGQIITELLRSEPMGYLS